MKSALRNPFVWAFVVGCAVVTLMRPLLRREPPPPPVLRQLPRFELVGSNGKPFGSDELRGHVYVVNFFFTDCTSLCPTLMKGMARLQERYREEKLDSIRLVSITADPERDTPERLRQAEGEYGVDPARWALLTGSRERVRDLAVTGFQVALGEPERTGAGLLDIAHSGKILLVDPAGRLRGYYDSDAMGLDEVFWRSKRVLETARSG
jgi:protein SCO1